MYKHSLCLSSHYRQEYFLPRPWSNRPVITCGSHDITGVPGGRCRSGRLAVLPPCEPRCVEAEALKGAQQVEAVVLGFGFRMNDLGQPSGERHFPSHRPQVPHVLRALMEKQSRKTVKGPSDWQWVRTRWFKLTLHLSTLLVLRPQQREMWIIIITEGLKVWHSNVRLLICSRTWDSEREVTQGDRI